MSLFNAIDISATGVNAMQTWIDASAGNIANANDAVATNQPAYAEQSAVLSALPATGSGQAGNGVAVHIALGSTAGVIEPSPSNPLADASGNVKLPNVSLADQLVGLMQAQDGYQANTSVISRAMAAYQAGLTIGS